jgi:hypothetical protein
MRATRSGNQKRVYLDNLLSGFAVEFAKGVVGHSSIKNVPGRLFYATIRGGYRSIYVPLSDRTRDEAARILETNRYRHRQRCFTRPSIVLDAIVCNASVLA